MKYMGSKSAMLKNGLGELLLEQNKDTERFFDFFSGSAAVSRFVAENTDSKVFSCDLQTYSFYLSQAVLSRDSLLSKSELSQIFDWIDNARKYQKRACGDLELKQTIKFVNDNRKLSSESKFLIVRAYGGYYFSYGQMLTINYLMKTIPGDEIVYSVAMASLIETASYCAASPGHTAQPFQPKGNGLYAILDAWRKDILTTLEKKVLQLSNRFAKKIGESFIGNSVLITDKIQENDLVFLDPPYSGVHYSRFYHVLESISRRKIDEFTGSGRYPAPKDRPTSDFSMKGKSRIAIDTLFERISQKRAKAIITFPNGECSNGLSGPVVKNLAKKHFKVSKEIIKGRFSTLGGNNKNRPARHSSEELVLLLSPK